MLEKSRNVRSLIKIYITNAILSYGKVYMTILAVEHFNFQDKNVVNEFLYTQNYFNLSDLFSIRSVLEQSTEK
jgi:hypothetical protein